MGNQLFLLGWEINGESRRLYRLFKTARSSLLVSVFFPLVYAFSFEGRVVEVLSGDTVVIQESGNDKRTVVRLLAADAPEENQTGYGRSKRALAKLVRLRTVLVEPSLRQICSKGACVALGRIWTPSEDVALRLIRLGLLWHDTRQVPDQPTADRSLYRDAASAAVRGKKGLWAKTGAVPPWEFQAPASPRGIASKKRRAKKPLNKD